MKRLLFMALLFVVALLASANKPNRTAYTTGGTDYYTLPRGTGYVSDSLFSAEWDTLTFWVDPKAEWFGIYIKPTIFGSDATDSLIIKYRTLPSITLVDNVAGSMFQTLAIINESGVSVTSLDWTSGSIYTVYDPDSARASGAEGFAPPFGKYIQFLLSNGLASGDTSLYVLWFQQGNSSE